MAQRERGIGTEAGKTADVKGKPVRGGSEEERANAQRGSGFFRVLPRSGLVQWKLIGIGGSLAAPPLPHHRAYGSVPRRFDRVKPAQA